MYEAPLDHQSVIGLIKRIIREKMFVILSVRHQLICLPLASRIVLLC